MPFIPPAGVASPPAHGELSRTVEAKAECISPSHRPRRKVSIKIPEAPNRRVYFQLRKRGGV